MDQAPLVQMLDSAIQQIITIQLINIWETNCTVHWIEIYPVDSVIHLLNNWGQANRLMFYFGVYIFQSVVAQHILTSILLLKTFADITKQSFLIS